MSPVPWEGEKGVSQQGVPVLRSAAPAPPSLVPACSLLAGAVPGFPRKGRELGSRLELQAGQLMVWVTRGQGTKTIPPPPPGGNPWTGSSAPPPTCSPRPQTCATPLQDSPPCSIPGLPQPQAKGVAALGLGKGPLRAQPSPAIHNLLKQMRVWSFYFFISFI